MNITLEPITPNQQEIIKNIAQYFHYDFSEMNGMDLEENGKFRTIPDIDDYYSKPEYASYFIRVDNKLAGLAVIRFEGDTTYFRHFGILRKYRRQGIGLQVCHMLFDKYPGNWRVSQFDYNEPAIRFWRKIIGIYTRGNYSEVRRADNQGPQQEFYAGKTIQDNV
jgi:predicted acetyltransferase